MNNLKEMQKLYHFCLDKSAHINADGQLELLVEVYMAVFNF